MLKKKRDRDTQKWKSKTETARRQSMEEEKVERGRYEDVEKQKQLYITEVRQREGWGLKEQVAISQWRIAGKVSWNGSRNDECGSAGKPLIWIGRVCFCRKRICLCFIWSWRQWLHLGPDRGFTLNIKALFPSAQPESDSVPFNRRTEKCGRTEEVNVVLQYWFKEEPLPKGGRTLILNFYLYCYRFLKRHLIW